MTFHDICARAVPPFRLRIGGWRVMMRDDGALQVLTVAGRGGAYRE